MRFLCSCRRDKTVKYTGALAVFVQEIRAKVLHLFSEFVSQSKSACMHIMNKELFSKGIIVWLEKKF